MYVSSNHCDDGTFSFGAFFIVRDVTRSRPQSRPPVGRYRPKGGVAVRRTVTHYIPKIYTDWQRRSAAYSIELNAHLHDAI